MQSTQYYYIDDLFVAVENTRQTFPRIMNLAANDNSNQNLEYCVQAHQFSLIGNVEYIEKLKKTNEIDGQRIPGATYRMHYSSIKRWSKETTRIMF